MMHGTQRKKQNWELESHIEPRQCFLSASLVLSTHVCCILFLFSSHLAENIIFSLQVYMIQVQLQRAPILYDSLNSSRPDMS